MYDFLKSFGRWQKNYAAWMNAVFRLGGLLLLDAGTCYGAHVLAFRQVGIYAWGCDKEKKYVANSPFSEIRDFLFVWDITSPPPAAAMEYEVVVTHGVLEHIEKPDLAAAMQNLLTILRKGGFMVHIITTAESPNWAISGDPTHVTIETRSWWRNFFLQFPMIDLGAMYEPAIVRAEEWIFPFRRQYGWGVFAFEKAD